MRNGIKCQDLSHVRMEENDARRLSRAQISTSFDSSKSFLGLSEGHEPSIYLHLYSSLLFPSPSCPSSPFLVQLEGLLPNSTYPFQERAHATGGRGGLNKESSCDMVMVRHGMSWYVMVLMTHLEMLHSEA